MVATGMFSTALFQNQYRKSDSNTYSPSYSRDGSVFGSTGLSNLYSHQQDLFRRSVFSRNVLPVKETYMQVKGGFPKSEVVELLIRRAVESPGDLNDTQSGFFVYNEPKGFLAHIYKGNIINTFA